MISFVSFGDLRISHSASSLGYPISMRKRNRSSWLSGRGNVPDRSTGFCVAMTMKGLGRGLVVPSMLTCRSNMASSRALCARGSARLISSASKTFVKIGPSKKWKSADFGS